MTCTSVLRTRKWPQLLQKAVLARSLVGSTVLLQAALPAMGQLRFDTALDQGSPTSRESVETHASPAMQPSARYRLVPVEVVLNGASAGNWLLLESSAGFHAPKEALDAWRVRLNAPKTRVVFQQDNWYPLSAIDGYEGKLNAESQSLDVKFAPTAFVITRVAEDEPRLPALSRSERAAFVNYDLAWSKSLLSGAPSSNELGALTEWGFTGPAGVWTSSFLGRQVKSAGVGASAQWRRLETSFTSDFREHKLFLRVGDSTTRSGLTGRPFYFGGIQISRDFGLAPGFISQPLPLFVGSASVPSTVELYINEALRQTLKVPAGPFTIENSTPISGDGKARMVVRDALGRETLIAQSFFSHTELLEEGLSDWSVEVGAVRNNLGLNNADYGERFAMGLWRHGVNKRLTMEARGEFGEQTRGLGLGISKALPWQALGQATLAWSEQANQRQGLQWSLGSEYGQERQALALQAQGATKDYRTVGQNDALEPPKWQISGNFSHTLPSAGTFGFGLAMLYTSQQGRLDTYSLSHTMRVGTQGSLSTVFTRVRGTSSGSLFSVSLLWPLERQMHTAAYVTQRSGQTDAYSSVSQGSRGDTGIGWRALSGTRNGSAFGEAGVYLQGQRNQFTADLSTSSAQQTLRLGSQGGLVLMGGRVFLSRSVRDSFALVSVPGLPDVGVYFQGREVERTDAQGLALLTGLQPYSANSVRLSPSDLPLSAEIDNLEQVVVPLRRSAVNVGFSVRRGFAALVTALLPNRQPAPAGAEIELVGESERFPVGRGGQAFVTGLQYTQKLRLHWKDGSCLMTLSLAPEAPDDIARPPPLVCEDGIP